MVAPFLATEYPAEQGGSLYERIHNIHNKPTQEIQSQVQVPVPAPVVKVQPQKTIGTGNFEMSQSGLEISKYFGNDYNSHKPQAEVLENPINTNKYEPIFPELRYPRYIAKDNVNEEMLKRVAALIKDDVRSMIDDFFIKIIVTITVLFILSLNILILFHLANY